MRINFICHLLSPLSELKPDDAPPATRRCLGAPAFASRLQVNG